MRSAIAIGVPSLLVLCVWTGCSGAKNPLSSEDGGPGVSSGSSSGSGSGGTSSGGASGSGSSGGTGSSSGGGSGSGSSSGGSSEGGPSESGACPPCDPGNVNLPGVDCDLDCSGTTSPPPPCDSTLQAAGPAADFARALGICQMATGGSWGLMSATYTQGYDSTTAPAAGQHAILPAFGSSVAPREGSMLGVLSSGYGFTCDDPSQATTCTGSGTGDPYFKGAQAGMTGAGTAPPGYPKSTASCQVATTVYDTIGVTLQIKVPKNAQAMSFDFDFYSSEWPEYVCTSYNDSFVAWLQSAAWQGTGTDLNFAFDSSNDPISVNSPLLGQCTPDTETGCDGTVTATATCGAGPTALQGTGFYNLGTYCTTQSTGGGATGWLTASAPVQGGETITLQLIIWDTGDQNWDSSVLLDHLTWYGEPRPAGTGPAQ